MKAALTQAFVIQYKGMLFLQLVWQGFFIAAQKARRQRLRVMQHPLVICFVFPSNDHVVYFCKLCVRLCICVCVCVCAYVRIEFTCVCLRLSCHSMIINLT